MFCPSCKDEFRTGFTHCARCDVDLVEDLSRAGDGSAGAQPQSSPPPVAGPMLDYCGFFSLQDARQAREQLRKKYIRSEIVLREPLDANFDEPPQEEYWIRVESTRLKQAHQILGEDAPTEDAPTEDAPTEDAPTEDEPTDDSSFACSECGCRVNAAESFCPECGARFDD